MKSSCSLTLIMVAGAILATSTSLRAADTNSTSELSTPQPSLEAGAASNDQDSHYHQGDYYRPDELSMDAFGTASLGRYTIDHPSDARVRQNTQLGAGAGLNYFITRNIGIGVDAYSEHTTGIFVDSASADLILRLPLGQSGFAPYAFGGGGRRFDDVKAWFVTAGAGMEYRFTPHVGAFIDAGGVLPNETKYYGVARLGMRFAF